MKRISITSSILLGVMLVVNGQSPEAFKYQGIIRDGDGDPLVNDAVTLRFSIRSGGETGTIVYQETHTTATNAFGLVNLNVGQGNPVIGTFESVDWGASTHFLQTEVNNGGGFLNMGSYQLLSVPYALHALEAENGGSLPPGALNQTLRHDGTSWVASDFLKNDGSHVGIGTTAPGSDLEIYSNDYITGDPEIEDEVPFKIRNDFDFGLFLDASDIQSVNYPLFINGLNDEDVFMCSGGGQILMGDGVMMGWPTLINAWPLHKLYTIFATNDSASEDSHVIHAVHTGGDEGVDAVALYGNCVPVDFYGYGGKFIGGYKGATGECSGNSDGFYTGLYGMAEHSNTGTNAGVEGYGNFGAYNFGVRGIAFNSTSGSTGVFGNASGSTPSYGVYGSANTLAGYYGLYCMGNGAYTGTWTDVSDERFKENISPLSGALEGIRRLNVYNYTFRTDGEAALMNLDKGSQTGFISQELEAVFPELVRNDVNLVMHTHDPDSKQPAEYTRIDYKGINYIGMVPYLTQAIKEQQQIIDDQAKKLELLQSELQELRETIKNLVH
jgi:hypothetical protein